MPGWDFEGDFLHWPVSNPRRFNWNNAGLPFIGTCEDGRGGFDDKYQGTITSPRFTVNNSRIRLNVGGGAGKGVYVELIDDQGKQLRVARGKNTETLDEVTWDVSELRNRPLRIRIVDAETGGWGLEGCAGRASWNHPEPHPAAGKSWANMRRRSRSRTNTGRPQSA